MIERGWRARIVLLGAVVVKAMVLGMVMTTAHANDGAAMLAKLRSLHPSTTIQEVRPSGITGIWEVVMGQSTAYTDDSGRYFLFGHIYDMVQRVDLTAQRQAPPQPRKAAFPGAWLGQAIKTVRGNGSRVVAVFSDPDCVYCQRLERELAKLEDVTVYTFLYPLEGLHPQARAKAIAVWCAPDRGKAWEAVMNGGLAPRQVACSHPINDNLALGARLGVTGTPTLVALDGRVWPGAGPADQIDKWLGAGKADEVGK